MDHYITYMSRLSQYRIFTGLLMIKLIALQVTSIDGGSGTPGDVTMSKLETGCCDCWQNAYSLGLPWELDNGLKATFVGAVILLDLVLQDNNGG